jgi:sugar O-acyltransferase (sialic acid O-acetyltransferase NeuD family)
LAKENTDILIIGTGETGELAYHCFTQDSPYSVSAFCVEDEYKVNDYMKGLPIISLSNVKDTHPPSDFSTFIAVSHTDLNKIRENLFKKVKNMGYECVSYTSSSSIIWDTASIGDNVFIFENVSIQHNCTIGDNVMIWPGSTIAHRTSIGNNSYISPGVSISGFCNLGKNCFLGVNSSLSDGLSVGNFVVIGAGSVIIEDINDKKVYVGNPGQPLDREPSDLSL